ncbi:rifin [Plasmodium reichenowi]|uniref:Rifin n=1 Tax=Plasmodium reichenowi TaxID=5854 RepID=A0A060RLX2_PLARE|nr:rifin [Plasmodium reichenowi]
MKRHYAKIILFVIPLNILVHNKNKLYITPHHTQTNRSLCECDAQPSIYNKDEDIKSVKEIFERQTSQRFEEYEERMKEKRQKRKEERDKNIQQIIEKDKMEKSLAEKVEKGCLKCGCGLGGVAASVGIFGAVAVNELTKAATVSAFELATKKGIEEGVKVVIAKIKGSLFSMHFQGDWSNFINGSNYSASSGLVKAVKNALYSSGKSCTKSSSDNVCSTLNSQEQWFGTVAEAGKKAAADATVAAEEAELAKVSSASSYAYSAIGYSVLAILIIVLIMIIIYLVLRYRRKKKMNIKAQYTKLLNQ